MGSKNINPLLLLLLFIFSLGLTADISYSSTVKIKSGYWYYDIQVPIENINAALFTHLICAFADIDSSNYTLSLPQDALQSFTTFSATVRKANPSIVTLLSIGGGDGSKAPTYSSMVSQPSRRSAFIDSAIKTASAYGFDGLDLSWPSSPNSTSDMDNLGVLFHEWRRAAATRLDNGSGNASALILTMAVHYKPILDDTSLRFPVESMRQNLDWVHVMAQDYYAPAWNAFTAAHAALYNPRSPDVSTQYGVDTWVIRGMPVEKMVLCLPFYGYKWKLADPQDKNAGLGAPAIKATGSDTGYVSYREIRALIHADGGGAAVKFDGVYVVNYVVVGGYWIGYDDVEAIRTKVRYAKDKGLLGYTAWQVAHDDNSTLSAAAASAASAGVSPPTVPTGHRGRGTRIRAMIIIIVVSTVSLIAIILIGYVFWRKKPSEKLGNSQNVSDFTNEESLYIEYDIIKAATDDFSEANKLGQGGFGVVYKGIYATGQEIAVKRLSKESKQGDQEFKNEVSLLAKLQHRNLVRLLGFSKQRDEKLLIYEYVPNASLDRFLFDPIKRLQLNFERRYQIITGVARGLLYLHEDSRHRIIHCDLKPGNVLLDKNMNPKIADFGLARLFEMDQTHGDASEIRGTAGYMAPEYILGAQFSMKSDVFSFGVLVFETISGQKIKSLHVGEDNETLTLTTRAWRCWREGLTSNIVDPSIRDCSSWEIMRCIHIGLLCVQDDIIDRPTMNQVVMMLGSKSFTLPKPSQPKFVMPMGSGESQHTSENLLSRDEATMSESELHPR